MSTSTVIAFALYSVAMAGVWGLFVILRVHVKGYEEYSNYIHGVTQIMFYVLGVLTALGYLLVFTQDFGFDDAGVRRVSPGVAEETF